MFASGVDSISSIFKKTRLKKELYETVVVNTEETSRTQVFFVLCPYTRGKIESILLGTVKRAVDHRCKKTV